MSSSECSLHVAQNTMSRVLPSGILVGILDSGGFKSHITSETGEEGGGANNEENGNSRGKKEEGRWIVLAIRGARGNEEGSPPPQHENDNYNYAEEILTTLPGTLQQPQSMQKQHRYSAAAVINQINNDPLGITINKPWG